MQKLNNIHTPTHSSCVVGRCRCRSCYFAKPSTPSTELTVVMARASFSESLCELDAYAIPHHPLLLQPIVWQVSVYFYISHITTWINFADRTQQQPKNAPLASANRQPHHPFHHPHPNWVYYWNLWISLYATVRVTEAAVVSVLFRGLDAGGINRIGTQQRVISQSVSLLVQVGVVGGGCSIDEWSDTNHTEDWSNHASVFYSPH